MKNSKISSSSLLQPERDALEARFALRLTARLSQGSADLPHDVSERLRFAREQALERARTAKRVQTAAASTVVSTNGGAAALGASPSWWWRLAAVLPLVALVGGLAIIQQVQQQEQIDAAAEIDTALLADDLPPSAYSDPGFKEFLAAAPASEANATVIQ